MHTYAFKLSCTIYSHNEPDPTPTQAISEGARITIAAHAGCTGSVFAPLPLVRKAAYPFLLDLATALAPGHPT